MNDVASATNLANYSIPGITIVSAAVTNNNKTTGATVLLTVADGSINITLERPITIKGVMGFNGSFSAIETFPTQMVELKDNTKPYLIGNPEYNKPSNTIKFNFSEEMKGTMTLRISQTIGNNTFELPHDITMSGNSVLVTLKGTPAAGTLMRIDLLNNTLTDVSGNQVTPMQPQYPVFVPVN